MKGGIGKLEVECTGKVEIDEAEFLALGEACDAIEYSVLLQLSKAERLIAVGFQLLGD